MPRPLALKSRNRQPPDLGPKVRVETVRLNPAGDDAGLAALVNGRGLSDWDHDGLLEQGTSPRTMWLGACSADSSLEFDLPGPVPLGAIEVWNYNAEWQTTNGLRKATIAVSADGGATWQTVLHDFEFAEADGRPDYDQPIVLQLKGVLAQKVRFEKLTSWGSGAQAGLSAVVFHQAPGPMAAPRLPEDGARSVSFAKLALEWLPATDATEHRVYLGATSDQLELLGATKETRFEAAPLKPATAYCWRVDETRADGQIVTGRITRFSTAGLVAWWKLDESGGVEIKDASGHQLPGRLQGAAQWSAGPGALKGALEFDGKTTLVDCGADPQFDFRDHLTVSVWIKIRAFNQPWQAIINKGNSSWRLLRFQETGRVALICGDVKGPRGSEAILSSRRSVDDRQWHHLAATYDGAQMALYLDGVLDSSLQATGPLTPNDAAVFIGDYSQRGGYHWNGWMADVRLYDYALNADDIQALFRQAHEGERAAR